MLTSEGEVHDLEEAKYRGHGPRELNKTKFLSKFANEFNPTEEKEGERVEESVAELISDDVVQDITGGSLNNTSDVDDGEDRMELKVFSKPEDQEKVISDLFLPIISKYICLELSK